MNTILTVVNDNIDLSAQKILAYLKPQTHNADWEVAAWQACSPQPDGGSQQLDTITNEVGAFISFNNNKSKTAYKKIDPGYISAIKENGNELILGDPELDNSNLTEAQSGVKNGTTTKGIYPVWCLNKKSICKPSSQMFNDGFSSFELLQKVYFTIGSSLETDTFKVQNWDVLTEIDLPSNLVSADISATLNNATNKVTFTIENQKYLK
jgi:hypothetical protein